MEVKAKLYGYLGGRAAIERTLQKMERLVRKYRKTPEIIWTARKVLNAYGVPKNEDRREAEALYDFLLKHVRYTKDPVEVELVQDPRLTLAWRSGDCDDICVLAASLFQSVGLPTRFVLHQYPENDIPGHVLLAVQTKDGWLPFDVVYDRGLGSAPRGSLAVRGGIPEGRAA